MTVSLSPLGISGSALCVSVSGASGTSVEVILDGDGQSVRFVIPIMSGDGFRCLRLPAGFGRAAIASVQGAQGPPTTVIAPRI